MWRYEYPIIGARRIQLYAQSLRCRNGFVSRAQQHTYDGTTNRLAASVWNMLPSRFDHILLRKNGLPVKAAYYISTLRKEWKKGKFDLSDHYGVVPEIKF
ncbi:MAG: hypothetical protein U0T72_09025 [Chitinophagales bacterium]